MNVQAMLFEWLARQLGLFTGTLPTTIAPNYATLVQASVAASTPVVVAGRYYYAVQSSGVTGGDQFEIETSLDGTNWVAAPSPVPNPIVTNGIYNFSGIFNYIRAVQIAGAGTGTLITLTARS